MKKERAPSQTRIEAQEARWQHQLSVAAQSQIKRDRDRQALVLSEVLAHDTKTYQEMKIKAARDGANARKAMLKERERTKERADELLRAREIKLSGI